MRLLKLLGCAATLLALFGAGNGMAQQAPVAGRDYTLISPPQPTAGGMLEAHHRVSFAMSC